MKKTPKCRKLKWPQVWCGLILLSTNWVVFCSVDGIFCLPKTSPSHSVIHCHPFNPPQGDTKWPSLGFCSYPPGRTRTGPGRYGTRFLPKGRRPADGGERKTKAFQRSPSAWRYSKPVGWNFRAHMVCFLGCSGKKCLFVWMLLISLLLYTIFVVISLVVLVLVLLVVVVVAVVAAAASASAIYLLFYIYI